MISALAGAACVEVNGGAIELSWSVRSFTGERIDESCQDNDPRVHLGWIRLTWKAVEDAEDITEQEPDGWVQFPCADGRGITGFSVPRGQQMLRIVPVCADGMPATGRYQVPPPIVRTIEDGTVTTLDALLVVADESTCQ